uniref:Major facilitator superfamily (MFS) profile domain-containing protein n=2 Tax=Aegilops tauschii subsp. strangulata TaxID=200361 RepID=A0A453J534_AEGTS
GIGLLVLQQLSGINAILFYAGSIFKAAGLTNSNLAACGLGAIALLASGITSWLLDRAGRRILLIISSAGMTLSLLAVAVIFFLKDNVPQDSDMYYILSLVSLLAIVAYVFTFSFGMGAIPWVIMSEILPVSIKSLAGSFATLANWLTSFGITMTANLLLSWSAGGSHSSLFPLSSSRIMDPRHRPDGDHFCLFTISLFLRGLSVYDLDRYLCVLHARERVHARVHNPLGAGDQGKNSRGDTVVVPVSSVGSFRRMYVGIILQAGHRLLFTSRIAR